MPLTKAEARLEALKLAARPGLERAAIIETAEEYYGFIIKEEAQPTAEEINEAALVRQVKGKAK